MDPLFFAFLQNRIGGKGVGPTAILLNFYYLSPLSLIYICIYGDHFNFFGKSGGQKCFPCVATIMDFHALNNFFFLLEFLI